MESNSRSLIVPKLPRTPRARGEVTGNGKLFERSWPSTTSISRTLPFPWDEHVADRRCKHQSHILRLPLSGKTAERTEAGACREITRTRSCRPADHVSSGWRNLECARDSPVQRCKNCALCFGQLRKMAISGLFCCLLFCCLDPSRQA